MPVNRKQRIQIVGLLMPAMMVATQATAEEALSMDFLEYLGAEENEVDGEVSGPVDLDLERYLTASNPEDSKPVSGEGGEHE